MLPPTTQQAQSIAEQLLGRQLDGCEQFLPKAGGNDSFTFRLRVGPETMLLTVKKRPGTPVGVYFHGRLRAAGLPVPGLVAFEPGAGPNGEACAIWEWVAGTSAEWVRGEPCPYDESELGATLRRIHDLRFAGSFGFLGDNLEQRTFALPDLGPTSLSWGEFFHCDVVARYYINKGYLDLPEAEILSTLLARLRNELGRAETRLLHMGDIMHNGNLLVETGTGHIRAILDFTESMAGDPRWELAWIRYYFADYPDERPTFDLARFWAGYGAEYGSDDALGRFYLAAILLFEKLRFYDPASPRGRWAIATVKSILRGFA
ncbi:MAG TPA: aminoglycoside phosphotransferase family protein [Chloroflexota bacterium]|nr:aminoglycoside phosphotransferase family protein [Chloroflexota bacterium]